MHSRKRRLRAIAVILSACAVWSAAMLTGAARQGASKKKSAQNAASQASKAMPTREEGLMAWEQVYSVLTNPRCINCHTATNYPQQGDDRHRHLFNVVRGPEGKGGPSLQCAACHHESNADRGGIPGGRDWHLAPLSMKWQDLNDKVLSSGEVCRSVTDRSKNHNLDGAGLLKHHTEEPLVLWAFHPGLRADGSARTPPGLTHEQFVEATRKWVDAGTPCP
jgi:hypothetical protein